MNSFDLKVLQGPTRTVVDDYLLTPLRDRREVPGHGPGQSQSVVWRRPSAYATTLIDQGNTSSITGRNTIPAHIDNECTELK